MLRGEQYCPRGVRLALHASVESIIRMNQNLYDFAVVFFVLAIVGFALPFTTNYPGTANTFGPSSYIMAGGQTGTWFGPNQFARLETITLSNYSVTSLTPVSTQGTVWAGGWNGSQWLISGWVIDLPSPNGSDPYIFLYNGRNQVLGPSLDQYEGETTWHGGDIFAASSDGADWLLSGLGSGNLPSYGNSNHMSLALFNGTNFIDLSRMLPIQTDYILYANAWNGRYWLIGGGYGASGVLFSFDGSKIADLTAKLSRVIPKFGSVQSIAWNGQSWLIGGVNFLAAYDGHLFIDLTAALDTALEQNDGRCNSVNAIAWDGVGWVLGGGPPIAQRGLSHAWLVRYASGTFTNLTSKFSSTENELMPDESVLSIAATKGEWIIGGYLNGQRLLTEYDGFSFKNLSYLVSNYTYVNWVGVHLFPEIVTRLDRQNLSSTESPIPLLSERLIDETNWPRLVLAL